MTLPVSPVRSLRFVLTAALVVVALIVGGVFVALRVTMTGSGSIGTAYAKSWSVLEECTPSMPGDSRGSFGSASLSAHVKSDSRFVMDNELTAVSPGGTFSGRVTDVTIDNLRAKLSVAGPGQFLNVDKTMAPVWFRDDNNFLAYTYGSATGQVASVYGIAVDPVDGGVLVSSYGTVNGVDRYKVIKFSAAGVYVTEFGAFGTGNGQFSGAMAVWVAPDQSVWVTDGAGFRIQKFTTADGGLTYSYSTKVGASGSGDGQFAALGVPLPITGDTTNVYVGDRGNNRIQKFNFSATFQAKVTITATSVGVAPYGLAWDASASRLYATTGQDVAATLPVNGVVESYNSSLVLQGSTTIAAPTNTKFGLGNIAVDPNGGYWAQWFSATYLVRFTTAGVEEARWQSLYPATSDTNSNMAVAVGSAGAYALFRSGTPIYNPSYGGNYVTGFDYAPVMLSDAIQTYMEACDTTLNGWTLQYDATDYEVVFPGWTGNVWANLKELFATYNVELVYNHATSTFIVRDIGSATATIEDFGAGGVETVPQNLTGGRIVDVIYQQPRAGGGVVWDAATENVRLSINAGETNTGILYTVNHPAELAQPVPTDTLPIQPGQYYVVDSLGVHVTAAVWLAAGANINLAVGDSPGTISRTLIGPSAAISGFTGPFSFATGITPTDTPALSIVGNGTFCTPRTLIRAGSQGQPYSSPFMDTQDRALTRGHKPSQTDPAVTIRFRCPVSALPPMGQAVGTTFPFEQSKYRIQSVSWGNVMADVTAERFVTAADWTATWSGETAATYEAYWPDNGYSAGDEQVQPLRHA